MADTGAPNRADDRLGDRPGERPGAAPAPWVVPATLVLLFLLATWLTTRSTLWDRDEPRFSQAAVEMVTNGQYLFPTFNGELRPDKPILIYWLMALPLSLAGSSEWAVRAWAPVGLVLSAWLAWRVARRFLSPAGAALVPGILAVTPIALMQGTAATTDAVLLAATTAAMACFAAMLAEGWRTGHFVLLTLALGAAQLTKGPVGIAVPLLSMLAAVWFARKTRPLAPGFGGRLLLAALGSVAIFLAWAVPANEATGGEFARLGLGKHVVDRVGAPMEGHGPNYFLGLFFYVPVLLVGFLPWILQLPAALVGLWNGTLLEGKSRALLLGWSLAPFLLMSLVATKLAHYVLPIFPPLAILVAAVIDGAERGTLAPGPQRWLRRGTWIQGTLLLLILGALVFAAFHELARPLRGALLVLAAVIAVQGALALVLHARNRWRASAQAGFAGMVAVWITVGAVVLPRVEEIKIAPRMVREIRAALPFGTPTATCGFVEPSLNFYLGPQIVEHLNNDAELDAWIARPETGVLVISQKKRDELVARRGEGGLATLAVVEGYNYSKGRPLVLHALRRGAR